MTQRVQILLVTCDDLRQECKRKKLILQTGMSAAAGGLIYNRVKSQVSVETHF